MALFRDEGYVQIIDIVLAWINPRRGGKSVFMGGVATIVAGIDHIYPGESIGLCYR